MVICSLILSQWKTTTVELKWSVEWRPCRGNLETIIKMQFLALNVTATADNTEKLYIRYIFMDLLLFNLVAVRIFVCHRLVCCVLSYSRGCGRSYLHSINTPGEERQSESHENKAKCFFFVVFYLNIFGLFWNKGVLSVFNGALCSSSLWKWMVS